MNEESVCEIKVNQLKDELRKVNQPIYNTKPVLIQKLLTLMQPSPVLFLFKALLI